MTNLNFLIFFYLYIKTKIDYLQKKIISQKEIIDS